MNRTLVLVVSIFPLLIQEAAASYTRLNAFFYYKNAYCVDETHIAGTAILTFDDADVTSSNGVQIDNYFGPCRYFPNGYRDVSKYNIFGSHNISSMFRSGNCSVCSGYVGCTVDGTCATYMNPVKIVNRSSSSSSSSSSGYQMSFSQTQESLEAPALSLQQDFLESMATENTVVRSYQQQSSTTPSATSTNTNRQGSGYLLILLVSLAGIVGALLVYHGKKKRRRQHQSTRKSPLVVAEMTTGIQTTDYVRANAII